MLAPLSAISAVFDRGAFAGLLFPLAAASVLVSWALVAGTAGVGRILDARRDGGTESHG